MITNVKSVGVCVRNQQRALDFYVNQLGFEKRRDDRMGPTDRWIEVAPPGGGTVLVLFTPPGLESRIGSFANIILEADDIRATYDELVSRGVEFVEPPTTQPWGGMMAQFKDVDGNTFVLVQGTI